MRITIECSEKEARLISAALDLYCRIGLGQFHYLTDCNTVDKNVFERGVQDEFEKAATILSNIYTGMTGNGNFGIFHDKVGDDCKIAAHIHQQIRHEFWKHDGEQAPTKAAYPATICDLANIESPDFQLTITEVSNRKLEFTSEEKQELGKKGYKVYGGFAYKDNKLISLQYLYGRRIYRIGIEGVVIDPDGGEGWGRTWSTCEDFSELLTKC